MANSEKYPSQLAERFQIRLPDGLRDRIRDAAERNGRSMNAEIVDVLLQAYPEVMSQTDLHHSTVAELAYAETLEDVTKILDNANRVAESLNFPFQYEIGYKYGDEQEKQLIISFGTPNEKLSPNSVKAAINIPKPSEPLQNSGEKK